MGLSIYEEDLDSNYFCEQCRPDKHKETIAALENGTAIWEVRWEEHKRQQDEIETKEAKSKKGAKKGGSKRKSDLKIDSSQTVDGQDNSPLTPAESTKEAGKMASVKRKADSEVESSATKVQMHRSQFGHGLICFKATTKVRKVSEVHKSPTASPVEQTMPATPGVAAANQAQLNALKKAILSHLTVANDVSELKLEKDDTWESKAERLAVQIDAATTAAHSASGGYGKQLKMILANLKSNPKLSRDLAAHVLSPETFATMSSDDMASSKLKEERAQMQARADKQFTLTTDDGPHIRRTHKGEEIVENNSFTVSDEIPSVGPVRRRSTIEANEHMVGRSRENSIGSGEEVELPDIIPVRTASNAKVSLARQPPPISTKGPSRKPSGQSDFDLKKVLDQVSVQSPQSAAPPVSMPLPGGNGPPPEGPGEDAEVDKMLLDDEEPPYSPKLTRDPGVVWEGKVSIGDSGFLATATHIGGADRFPYQQLLPQELVIAGRIEGNLANEYLCSMRYSTPTDIVLVALRPHGNGAEQGFRELLERFISKERYGVLANKSPGNVRDTYLVPIRPTPAALPDFIENLEDHQVPHVRPEPMLLVVMIVRHVDVATNAISQLQSPSAVASVQRLSFNATTPTMSPITKDVHVQRPGPGNPHTGQAFETPRPISNDEQQRRAQQQGEILAAQVLGNLINSPTVTFLLPQAFHMRKLEWEIIRDILASDPRAREDLHVLGNQIKARKPSE